MYIRIHHSTRRGIRGAFCPRREGCAVIDVVATMAAPVLLAAVILGGAVAIYKSLVGK